MYCFPCSIASTSSPKRNKCLLPRREFRLLRGIFLSDFEISNFVCKFAIMKDSYKKTIIDFPSEVDEEFKARLYDQSSLENHMAVLSHCLHNRDAELNEEEKIQLLHALIDYLRDKPDNGNELSDALDTYEDACAFLNEPLSLDLFSDFFRVPFPNPEKAKFTFIDLFAGIGGIRLPFSEMGYKCVFSSEWDKHAQTTYLANFGEMPFGDICKESTKRFIPDSFDLLLAGFPCQAFSIMGKMKGFEDTRGTLFFEVASILKKHRPKAFLLENVKQLTTHDHGRTFQTILAALDDLGYSYKWSVLNALDFGVPQKRERVIIVGFRDRGVIDDFDFNFEQRSYDLNDVLQDDSEVDSSLFASDNILQKRQERTRGKDIFYPSVWHENKSGNISVLDYACALRTGASYNYLLINGRRRPSSRELLRFQGFPDNYGIVVSHSEIRRQTGNSVAVPMIREIAKKINTILSKYY